MDGGCEVLLVVLLDEVEVVREEEVEVEVDFVEVGFEDVLLVLEEDNAVSIAVCWTVATVTDVVMVTI